MPIKSESSWWDRVMRVMRVMRGDDSQVNGLNRVINGSFDVLVAR